MIYDAYLFNKSIYGVGLLPQTSDLTHYRNEDALRRGKTCEEDFSDGWHGGRFERFSSALEGYLTGEACGLSPIDPTLAPELQGYGKNQYLNSQYPFDGTLDIPTGASIPGDNPCIVYYKDFLFREPQPEERIRIRFLGSENAFFLYVNGHFAGYSENLYLDSVFDVTDEIHAGKNRVSVLCFAHSTSTWLLCQDFFRFSGLFRGVRLAVLDAVAVEDVEAVSWVDPKKAKAELTVRCTGDSVERECLLRRDDSIVWQTVTTQNLVSTKLSDIALWSAEEPALYRLEVRTRRCGDIIDIAVCDIGFRDVRIVDGQLLLNGKRLILNGINRHEWHPERGRSVTDEDMTFDLRFLKEHNINAVRTSHYPNRNEWYRLCDKGGLYVMDEACLETHGTFAAVPAYRREEAIPGDDMSWYPLCVTRVLRMYERDKNHPSVLFWSLGNESGTGSVFFRMREALKTRAPEAIVHYEQGYPDEYAMRVSDLYSSMYTSAADVADFLQNHTDKPYILCEFCHAMGNSLGDLAAYRNLLDRYPNFQGGFIWDYIDQALLAKDLNGKKKLCYGGDFGDRPNDGDFSANGIIFADRRRAHLSAKAETVRYHYQPLDFTWQGSDLVIANHYLFRSTKHLTFVFEVLVNGETIEKQDLTFDIPAGRRKRVTLHGKVADDGETLWRIRALQKKDENAVPGGTLVAFGETIVRRTETPAPVPAEAPVVTIGHYNIGVQAGNVRYLFAKSGVSFRVAGLISLTVDGEEYLMRGPLPTVFRPTTDNDCSNGFRFAAAPALGYSQNVRCDQGATTWETVNQQFYITFRYIFDDARGEGATVTYCIDGAGRCRLAACLDPLSGIPSLPLFGLSLQLPLDKGRFGWFGRGPLESYPDRKAGIMSGNWHSRTDAEYTNYLYPQECGNHEDTRSLTVYGKDSSLTVSGEPTFSFKYLPYSDFAIENATHREELPTPHAGHLTLCGFMRGVGGDDSWGAPVHDRFTLPATASYGFSLILIPNTHKGTK